MKFKTALIVKRIIVVYLYLLLALVDLGVICGGATDKYSNEVSSNDNAMVVIITIIVGFLVYFICSFIAIRAEFVDDKIIFTNFFNKKKAFLLADCEKVYYSIFNGFIGYNFIALKFKKRTIRIYHREFLVKDMPSKIVIDNLDKFINADISGIDGVDS